MHLLYFLLFLLLFTSVCPAVLAASFSRYLGLFSLMLIFLSCGLIVIVSMFSLIFLNTHGRDSCMCITCAVLKSFLFFGGSLWCSAQCSVLDGLLAWNE